MPAKTASKVVANTDIDLAQMEAVVAETAQMQAPTISRAVSARNQLQMRINELERERGDFSDRRALLRAQYEAADAALMEHERDIDETLSLYRAGMPMAAE